MVQRKVVNKLGILDDDHMKSDKRLVSTPFKPSLQNQLDIKNSGTDLKKKMKKSGSMKRPELDGRRMKQPGNQLPVRAEMPQTVSPACSIPVLPNYMKSTSSSVARKEKSQVSNRSSENLSKLGLSSGKNATKTPNGLKTTKVLTKNPTFRCGRSLMRKCAEVVLCENLDVQRATCSSTLKNCKHPAYLVLDSGGIESEGTSVMKVCPYTYCSLNGHHRDPLQPLKSFLSSRRRILKTQRHTNEQGDLTSCLMKARVDFFIEMYAEGQGNTAGYERTSDHIANDSAEAISVDSIKNCIDFHENLDEDGDGKKTDVDADSCPVTEEIPVPSLDPEETEPGIFVTWNDFPTEVLGGVQLDEQDSEAFDMDNVNIDYEYLSFEEKITKFDNYCDEFRAKEVSMETSRDGSLKTDDLSSNDDCESVVSLDYIDGEKNINTLSPAEIPEEKAAAAYEDTPGTNAQISDAGMVYHVGDLKDDPVETGKSNSETVIAVVSESDKLSLDGGLQIEETFKSGCFVDFAEDSNLEFVERSLMETECIIVNERIADNATQAGIERCSSAGKSKGAFRKVNLHDDCITNDGLKLEIASKRSNPENQEEGEFNPREPNFLPLQPVPESEKVDLRHQELDENKNAEEWMVDYALRQAVAKLGPARRKKVELLVEAFEKVMPTEKCEIKPRHGSLLTMSEQFRHITCN